MINKKKGAVEMTMGTIVTIVLMVAILVVILFFIGKVGDTSEDAINGIDQALQNEINALFTDGNKKIIVFPTSREIVLKKGEVKGLGFSIRNVEGTSGSFSYEVGAKEIGADCSGVSIEKANSYINLGKSGSGINLPSGSFMEDAIFVKFSIPESASLCTMRYGIDVKKGVEQYSPTIFFDMTIE
jgi:hypothetical protein